MLQGIGIHIGSSQISVAVAEKRRLRMKSFHDGRHGNSPLEFLSPAADYSVESREFLDPLDSDHLAANQPDQVRLPGWVGSVGSMVPLYRSQGFSILAHHVCSDFLRWIRLRLEPGDSKRSRTPVVLAVSDVRAANVGCRNALLAAARHAGFDNALVVPSSAAACRYYHAIRRRWTRQPCLIADGGLDSLNLTLVASDDKSVTRAIYPTRQIRSLGGRELNGHLHRFLTSHRWVAPTPERGESESVARERSVERLKHQLCRGQRIQVALGNTNAMGTVTAASQAAAGTRSLGLIEWARELEGTLEQTREDAETLCREAGLRPSDLKYLACAGGSFYAPFLLRGLRLRQGPRLLSDKRPRHIFALGAGQMAGSRGFEDIVADAVNDPSRWTRLRRPIGDPTICKRISQPDGLRAVLKYNRDYAIGFRFAYFAAQRSICLVADLPPNSKDAQEIEELLDWVGEYLETYKKLPSPPPSIHEAVANWQQAVIRIIEREIGRWGATRAQANGDPRTRIYRLRDGSRFSVDVRRGGVVCEIPLTVRSDPAGFADLLRLNDLTNGLRIGINGEGVPVLQADILNGDSSKAGIFVRLHQLVAGGKELSQRLTNLRRSSAEMYV